MCHWIRDAEFERRRAQQGLPPSELPKVPSRRLAGAVAAAVAILAVAAVAFLAPSPAESTARSAAPTAQTAAAPARTGGNGAVPAPHAAAPAGMVVEQTAAGLDDGVPIGTEGKGATAGGTYCSHDL